MFFQYCLQCQTIVFQKHLFFLPLFPLYLPSLSSVITVSAFSFRNVGVTYEILENNVDYPHTIGTSGIITLTRKVDREQMSSYFLDIRATESGVDNPMSAEVRVCWNLSMLKFSQEQILPGK